MKLCRPRQKIPVCKFLQGLFYFTLFSSSEPLQAAAFSVTSLNDSGANTLRQAIIDANTTGGPGSTITFNVAGTITLTSTSLPPLGPNITVIDANNNAITINGANAFQPFFAIPGVTLSIQNTGGGGIVLQNTASVGGIGGSSIGSAGGGALGAGGGLFVGTGSSVTIEGLSFSSCSAVGGAGGTTSGVFITGAGGGAGMSGGNGGNCSVFGGGGGGGYGGGGGSAQRFGGGGGGGLFTSGGASGSPGAGAGGGGGGGSDNANGNAGNSTQGGNGANGTTGSGGAGGSAGGAGGAGTLNSGGGGGGPALLGTGGTGGAGGNANFGAGGGGGGDIDSGTPAPGGMGGSSTGLFGGGGGGGASELAAGSGGGSGGSFAGGGGGAVGGAGGAGGFGGGGGGSGDQGSFAIGGSGGFGGGGGGGGNPIGGPGGFGAGRGGEVIGAGGGGAGLGGAIFVQNGGTLVVKDPNVPPIFQGSVVTGGAGGMATGSGAAGQAGQGLGPDIFLMSSGTINFQQASTFTISNPIASDQGAGGGSTTTGGIAMNNAAGTLILAASNTYTGSTTLTAGNVKINSDSNLGAAAAPVNFNGGSLEFTGSTTLNASRPLNLNAAAPIFVDAGVMAAVNGIIQGAGGALTINGPGTFDPSNAGNTYSMGTVVQGNAIVQINNPGNLGAIAGTNLLNLNGGTLELLAAYGNGAFMNPINVSALNGTIQQDISASSLKSTFNGALTLNGALTINQIPPGAPTFASSITLAGTITGPGSLIMNGPGILFLVDNPNTYMGGTTLSNGFVQIIAPSSLGSGPLNFNGGTLELIPGFAPSTINNPITVSANGRILSDIASASSAIFSGNISGVGSNNLQIQQVNASSLTLSGAISGAMSLTMDGVGTLILSNAANSYSAGTFLEGGTTQLSNPASAVNPTNLGTGTVFFIGGKLELLSNYGDGNTISNLLSVNTSGTIQSDLPAAQTVTFSGNVNATPGGPLAFSQTAASNIILSGSISGANSLVQNGIGTLILSGSNSYTGPTSILGGTLRIDTSASLPSSSNVLDNGVLVFNTSANYPGAVSGTGSLTVQNGGTVILSGSNTYAGGTSIAPLSTLQINAPASLPSAGGILDNGHLVFNYGSPGVASITGLISGIGDLTMQGTGVLQLRNSSNSYSGGTNFNSGTIQVFSTGVLGLGPLTFNGGTLKISGIFLSSQPATLNASGGTVQVDSGTFGVLGGAIGGVGGLTTQGPGTLFLGGANNYTGTTTVQSGTLFVEVGASITSPMAMTIQSGAAFVNGTVTSPIFVNSGATLGGTGTVGSPINDITVNGIISPGVNNVGTLSGSSFHLNASSSYVLQINNTTADLIASTGTVAINGGVLQINPVGFTFPAVTSYTVITAPTVMTNTPFTLINPLTRYPFVLQYSPTSVQLVLNAPPIPFFVIVPSGNAAAVARCFDILIGKNIPDLGEVIQILELQTPSQIAHSLNQMQPANFNNIYFAQENVAERIRQIYTDHFFEQRVINCPETEKWRFWAAPFVERARQHGKGSLPGYLERFSGFSAAVDYRLQKHWMFTGGFSFASTEMNVPHGRASADFKTYAGTLGAAWTDSSFFADALFSYLYSPVEAKRKMHFAVSNFALTAQVNRTAKHRDASNQVLGHLGGGYDFKIKATKHSTYNIYPFANLDYLYIPQDGYTEHGAQSLDLKVRDKSYDLLRPEGGIGVGYKGCFEHVEAVLDLAVSYIHEFRFLGEKTRARFKPIDCTFTVTGLKPENNLVSPSARLRIASPVNGYSLTLGYHGEYGEHFILNAGEAELRKSF